MKKILSIIFITMMLVLASNVEAAKMGTSFNTALTISDFYEISVDNVDQSGRYFKFTAPYTAKYTIETSGDNRLFKGVYNEDYSEKISISNYPASMNLGVNLTAGKTYYIYTGSSETSTDPISYYMYIYCDVTIGDYTVTAYTNNCVIKSYTGSANSLTIPETIGGMIPELSSSSFQSNATLETVVIPGSYKIIDGFNKCANLKEVILNEGTEIIGESAFRDSKLLTTINFPKSIKELQYMAFYGCAGIQNITIPDTVTMIDEYVFRGCTSLEKVTLPEGITVIPRNAFYGCSALADITIPSTVQIIDRSAFRNCTSLTQITLPVQLNELASDVFRDCTQLGSVTFLSKDVVIAEDSFDGCNNLKLYGYAGSTAEAYAAEYGIPFETINVIEPDPEDGPLEFEPFNPEINLGESVTTENELTIFKSEYSGIHSFKDGYATVYFDEQSAVVDSNNMIHYSVSSGLGNYREDIVAVYDYANDVITFTRFDGYAFNVSGYVWAGDFIGGKCSILSTDGYYHLIDSTGQYLIEDPCSEILYNESNTVMVNIEEQWITVQLNNSKVSMYADRESAGVNALSADFEIYDPKLSTTGKHIICSNGTAYGIVDMGNVPVTEFLYDVIYDADNGVFIAYRGEYVDLIDIDGNITASVLAFYVGEYSDGMVACYDGESFKYIDKYGNVEIIVNENDVTYAGPFHDGYAVVEVEGKGYTYIDTSGSYAVNEYWDYAGIFAEGYSLVMNVVETDTGNIRLWSILDDTFTLVAQLDDEVYVDMDDEHSLDFTNGYIRTINRDTNLMGFIRLNDYDFSVKSNVLLGDINSDGVVNHQDRILLNRYFAGWDVQISEEAADVNVDGLITRRDAMILSRHVAGWVGYTLPYTQALIK